jgi:gliding motility-associated transport system permease protein/gliding motility-associatede transport system auxiliary component
MGAIFRELLWLLAIDLVFVAILMAVMVPLAAFKKAAYAVLKRNFIGYFSNPTGYVFLCLFVLLTSTAAFWPHEFFVANLANLDQLNYWLPLIMLVFVPAITMSIWAEEKRQGTDELLLTLPAADFDIVIGKYLAAASIFTVSLLLSQLANYTMLVWLTLDPDTYVVDLDTGLFFTTYFGYWLIGLAMLSVGMVASFLTNNLTVSFILGMLFNSVLVGTQFADMVVPSSALAQRISRWSYAAQFDDFGRGVISLSSTAFFVLIIVVGVYVSMVLIGKRHWSGGRDGQSMWWHYLLRALSLVVVLVGVNLLLERWDYLRQDCTAGQVSSLSPDTRKLLSELAAKDTRPIKIHAYMSAQVPDEYVKTRYNLISMLKELSRQAGSRVRVEMHDNLEPFSEEASQAEERFGITRQVVRTQSRGAFKEEEFILGAAFSCGRENVVVPFFGNGVPVEYELIRSIATVGHGERKKLGVVQTDANLSGGFSFAGGQPRQIPKQLILAELEKQYKVEEVDATNPIEAGKYDALLVVQPSSLGPQQLANVVDAVAKGQPAAIFEDPFPYVMGQVVGTGEPKPPMGGMMGMGGQPQPKGDIRALWKALGIQVTGDSGAGGGEFGEVPATIVWQEFNPYPKFQIRGIGPELVFIRNDAPGATNAFNPQEPVCANFEELLVPYPTGITQALGSKLSFTELIATSSTMSGTIKVSDWQSSQVDPYLLEEKRGKHSKGKFTLAAWIRAEEPAGGTADKEGAKSAKADDKKAAAAAKPKGINVIYVGDIDLMHSEFVQLRNQPNTEINFRFDNVPFVLNVIDAVAGDTRFLDIRTRKPRHSTLKTVEARAASAREEESKATGVASAKYEDLKKKVEAGQKEAEKTFAEIQKKFQDDLAAGKEVDRSAAIGQIQIWATKVEAEKRKAEVELERIRNDRDKELAQVERNRDQDIQKIQNEFKVWATVIPPIPPLLVGMIVWIRRRLREREGVSRSRMK